MTVYHTVCFALDWWVSLLKIYFSYFLGWLFLISSAGSVSAEGYFQFTGDIRSIDGTAIEVEKLRERVRNIDLHSIESSLSSVMNFEFVTDQIVTSLEQACGQDDELSDFFNLHGFQAFELKPDEKYLLNSCVTGVFTFADTTFGFAAPGLYKRFNPEYVSLVVEQGYRCGYRSQRLLSRYALSAWIFHPRDLEKMNKFRCLGDQTSEYKYTEQSIEWGVSRISDEVLFAVTVFESWNDAKRYQEYVDLVKRNRETAMCEDLMSNPFEDDDFQKEMVLESDCLAILAPSTGERND